MKQQAKKNWLIKRIGDLISAVTTILVFVTLFSPKDYDGSFLRWSMHWVYCIRLELLLFLLLYFGLRFGRQISTAVRSTSDKLLGSWDSYFLKKYTSYFVIGLFSVSLLITWEDCYSFVKRRYSYWKFGITRSFKQDLVDKSKQHEAKGEFEAAIRYYKLVVSEFPNANNARYERKINELSSRLQYSDQYYQLSKIDVDTEKFSRTQFNYLVSAFKLNPEDAFLKNLIVSKTKFLETLLDTGSTFYDSIKENDQSQIDFLMNEYGWFIFDDSYIQRFYNKASEGWDIDKLSQLVLHKEKSAFVNTISASWLLPLVPNVLEWAERLGDPEVLEERKIIRDYAGY